MGEDMTEARPQMRIARTETRKAVAYAVKWAVIWSLALLAVVYFCFAATILRFIPGISTGPILVKEQTWAGSIPSYSDYAVVSTQGRKMHDTVLSRLAQALIPTDDVAVVRILAGPYGMISADDETVTVDDKSFRIKLAEGENAPSMLRDEFLVQCMSGNCTADTALIVSLDEIYGQPVGMKDGE